VRREEKGREREREEKGRGGENSPPGIQIPAISTPNPGHHGEREVEEGGGGCCAGNPNERGRGEGGRMGRWAGARGPGRTRPGRAGLGWAALGWVGPGHFVDRNPRHARPLKEINCQPKSETERDEHATSDKEMRFGMMQHP
jgi:hypothetical protein